MNIHFILILIAYALIGTTTPVSRHAIETLPPWLFMALTGAFATALTFAIACATEKPKWLKFGRRAYLGLGIQGLVCSSLTTVLTLYGLSYTSSITTGVIVSAVPAATLILAFIFLRERITGPKMIAIALACVGVLLVSIANSEGGPQTSSWIGVLLLCCSVVTSASFFILAKYFAVELSPATITTCLTAIASVVSFGFSLQELQSFNWDQVTAKVWWEVIYYSIFYWAFPTYITFRSLRYVEASSFGMAMAVTPAAAVITAVALFGEMLTYTEVVALALVALSVYIAEKINSKSAPTNEKEPHSMSQNLQG